MIIDAPNRHQIPLLQALWQQAFGDSDAFLDGFFSVGFSPERCRGLWEDEMLCAALYWFDCQWQGRKVAYIYAVATDRTQRGKGFCRTLMEFTHGVLKTRGYAGAILVPGSKDLFALYEKVGYTSCCPMTVKEVEAKEEIAVVNKVTAAEYARLQKKYAPQNSVLHTQPTLAFAATFGGFYAGDGFAFCGGMEDITFYFQEFFGDDKLVPAILAALHTKKGQLRVAGGENYAMYRSFREDRALPDYFGIPLN